MSNLTKKLMTERESRRPEEAPETPYHMARKYSDDRLGNVVKQSANWRMAFWGVMAFALISLVGWISAVSRPPLPPLVVEVDHNTGVSNVVGRLGASHYEPQLAEIQFFIGRFLNLVRNIPVDPVVVKKNWLDAYKFTRQTAAAMLNEWANQPDGQLSKLGKESVSIDVLAVTKVADSQSYQARWRETIFTETGAVKESYIMTGLFTVEVDPPLDEASVLVNPLGIYIRNFQWTKEVKDKGDIKHKSESGE